MADDTPLLDTLADMTAVSITRVELSERDLPWLRHINGIPQQLSAEKLREAFIQFLIDFTHRANPAATHPKFTDLERRGAETFRDRCA